MNATPMNLNPAHAAQAQSGAAKPQDSAAPEVPFSQVLSSEMAQNRKNDAAGEGADAAATEAPGQAEAGADSAAEAAPGEESARAPLAEDSAVAPETLLALAINPDLLKPAAAATEGVAAEPPVLDARKGRTPPKAQSGQLADDARGARKTDPAQSGKADFQAAAAATAAAASAFSGQPAAARQSDAMKTGEFLSDLMSHPALRPAPQAALESMPALNDPASPKLAPTVGTTAWGQALGEKLVWMTAGAQQTASLTLNPPNLGPLQIVLNVSNDQATASFFSAQPEVRQALEAAMPKLREMMDEAGIQLGQATVSADTPRQNDTSDQPGQRIASRFAVPDEAASAGLQAVQPPPTQSGRGLIDTFA